MANVLPVMLTATVSIRERMLIVKSNEAVAAQRIAVEFAEWIWEEMLGLGGGDRRLERAIPGATVSLLEKGITITIGTANLFWTLDGRARGILAERQAVESTGTAPGLWTVVSL